VFHRTAHVVSMKKATAWSLVWMTLALAFNCVLYLDAASSFAANERLLAIPGLDPDVAARQVGLEYLEKGARPLLHLT
jgi:hypothetical protein